MFFVTGTLYPANAISAAETGSITFQFEGIADAKFSLYKVASIDQKGNIVRTENFKKYAVDIQDNTAAETLQYYVKQDQIPADAYDTTNANGIIVFDQLDQGIYLILGDRFERDGKIYSPQPVIVSVPSEKKNWNVDVHAKYSENDKPTSDRTNISVQKIWKDGESKDRPKSVVVQLSTKDGVYDEVLLNEDKNWKKEWKDLDANKEWFVTEKDVPEGYNVSISKQDTEYVFVVTNTKKGNTPPGPNGDGGGNGGGHGGGGSHNKLPQTGQLWWPVGLLLCGGMLSIIIGLKIGYRKVED